MNKELKSALLKYLYNNEQNVLVTRDARLMGILKSYEPGVKPSPEEVERKYNELLQQESLGKNTVVQEKQPIVPEGQSGYDVLEKPSVLINDVNAKVLKNTPTDKKLNQIGYANIVLMSIIVIVIVAILCVFIFM